jgi:hypothetical protein
VFAANGLGIAVCAGLLARQPKLLQMMNSDKKNNLRTTASIAAIPCYALVPEWLFCRKIEKQMRGCIIFFES